MEIGANHHARRTAAITIEGCQARSRVPGVIEGAREDANQQRQSFTSRGSGPWRGFLFEGTLYPGTGTATRPNRVSLFAGRDQRTGETLRIRSIPSSNLTETVRVALRDEAPPAHAIRRPRFLSADPRSDRGGRRVPPGPGRTGRNHALGLPQRGLPCIAGPLSYCPHFPANRRSTHVSAQPHPGSDPLSRPESGAHPDRPRNPSRAARGFCPFRVWRLACPRTCLEKGPVRPWRPNSSRASRIRC